MDTKQEFYEIDINLLPHKRKIRRTLDKQTRLILNIGIALVIIMAVIYAGLTYQIYT